jgi:hypothetical protein
MIGRRELARLRPGSYVANLARGGIVDDHALVAALESGHVRGAVLDVYATEPLPADSALRSLPEGSSQLLLSPHAAGSSQLRWLAREAARPGTCRLAFMHRPRFSGGRHGDQPDVAPLWNALRGRAALVVAGHDHDMQRLRPIDGITSFVSGAGGHGRYELRPDARRAFGDDRTYGALRIDLRPGHARLRFVAAGGRVLDSSAVRCRQPSA